MSPTVSISIHLLMDAMVVPPSLFFFWVPGFELGVLHFLGRRSTTWATSPAPYCVGYFRDRISHCWTLILLISASWETGTWLGCFLIHDQYCSDHGRADFGLRWPLLPREAFPSWGLNGVNHGSGWCALSIRIFQCWVTKEPHVFGNKSFCPPKVLISESGSECGDV
jgi:hypothetical protein